METTMIMKPPGSRCSLPLQGALATSGQPLAVLEAARRRPRHLLALLGCWLAAALAACGGHGSGGGVPPANNAPQAAFSAAGAVTAGDALAFDASASSDVDGDALTFSWDFGDGTRGGGAELAHVFAGSGNFTVTLTVADGRGGSASTTRDITVSAAPPLQAPAPSVALVSDADGPLAGVSVAVLGTQASATTGNDGRANIAIATGAAVTLRFSKAGYADQFKRVQMPAGAAGTQVQVRMLAREATLTLADASAGGTLAGKHGATLVLPPNALVDGAGNPVSGAVHVALTPVDVASEVRNFPGSFQGLRASGARGLIESYGTVEFVPTQNGAPLQVAAGRTVTIDIPIYTALHRDGSAVAAGQQVPLWSLDERTAAWVQEGVGTVVANNASPSGFALRAEVSHLSWWNCDQWLGTIPEDSYNPKVKCCIRDTPNGQCKENSGDICEHTGSGPAGAGGGSAALQRALGLARSQQAAPQRVPAVAAFATAPAIAGAVLPMPSNMDITLESTARNGTYRGVAVLRGGAGVSEDVTVSVLPVSGGGSDEPITLPWSQDYSVQSVGEVDRFKLAMPAGPGFEVTVSRSGSTLGGALKVTRPDGSVVATQNFGTNAAYIAENTVATAGEYTIEVTAGSNAPGAYKLEAVSFGTCASTQTATLPFNQALSLGPKQSRCLDVALAADDVIHIEPGQTGNNMAGSVSLATAGGAQQIASHTYPGAAPITSGVSVGGTYRVRVTNTTLNSGTLEMAITKPVVQVLNVPGSVTLSNFGPGAAEQLFLIKPPANGLYHVALAATNLQAGVQVEPAGASFVTTAQDARALRNVAPALPVARVFRNSGSGNTVVLSTGVPTLINRDADVDGASANGLRVHAFDANAGDVVSFGFARPEASSDVSMLSVYRPSGATVGGNSAAHTLAESGLHTALVAPLGANTGAYTLRINNVPAIAPLPLPTALTQQSVNLALGQVHRWSVTLAAGDLVGLNLDTTGPLHVDAALSGVFDGFAVTPSSGSGPFSVAGATRFVGASATSTLTLRSSSNVLERARGAVTLGVVHPSAANASTNAAQTGTLAANAWTTFRYTVPASGRYLLRVGTATPAPYALAATVWASSSPLTNYSGEFTSGVSSSFPPVEALGLLAAGSYTVSVRNNNAQGPVQFDMALVDLEAPTPLAINGAAVAGQIDVAAERDFASFTATAGQAFTLRATPGFNGLLRVRKLSPDGNWAARDDAFNTFSIPGTPTAVSTGQQAVWSFTIPTAAPFGDGTYIVEIAADGVASGNYTMQLTSP
jgi:PKD repeat protein